MNQKNKEPLTKKQKEILDFLTVFIQKKGYAPALEEVKKEFKLSAISTVWYYFNEFEKKGYIVRKKYRPRYIQLI